MERGFGGENTRTPSRLWRHSVLLAVLVSPSVRGDRYDNESVRHFPEEGHEDTNNGSVPGFI